MPEPHVLFLFLDGVGLGPGGPENPLDRESWTGLAALAHGQRWTADLDRIRSDRRLARAIDATLGVPGLPQSGTGQAALFSGINAARIAGRHYGPFPPSSSRDRLARESIFRRARALPGLSDPAVAFANAYPEIFFEERARRNRWTVTTFCCREADVPLRGWAEWRARRALTADLTGEAWRDQLGYELDPITEEEAGARLARLSGSYALTVFEYFLTDKAGHAADPEYSARVIDSLDRFVDALTEAVDFDRQLLVLTSDHGNIEDLSSGTHTRNPVPLIARGPGARRLGAVGSILGVTSSILKVLETAADCAGS